MADKKNWWEEPTKAPDTGTAPTAPKLNYTSWLDTTQGQAASTARKDAETALNKHGDFSFLQQDWMDQVLSDIKNRPDFSYNFNEDALYQQYKDKYIKQGKMAMADTIGQASAMTGGYGNSYAQSVGQQAYQASLENLNDIVPELYQMAYDRYNQEGQDLYNQYGLLMEEYKRAYGEHSDEYQKLLTALNRADSEFYNGANLHQTEQSMANSVAQNNWQNEFSAWDANNQNAWTKAQWDESARQYAEQKALETQRYADSIGAKVTKDEKGNLVVDESSVVPSVPKKVIDGVKGYSTEQGQADYLAKQVNNGVITEAQAHEILNEHGTTDLVNRSWEMVDDGGINWFGIGIDANAKVKDETGKVYKLSELRKELEKTMTRKEANKWIKDLEKRLGI